jgi:hypothetical protein
MNSKTLALLVAAGTTLLFAVTLCLWAQSSGGSQRYEVAIIKWDGSDKLQLITPQRSEFLRLFQSGVQLPRDIHDEEFCLTWAANKLAQQGWEPVNLDDTRILMRRAVNR